MSFIRNVWVLGWKKIQLALFANTILGLRGKKNNLKGNQEGLLEYLDLVEIYMIFIKYEIKKFKIPNIIIKNILSLLFITIVEILIIYKLLLHNNIKFVNLR